MNAMPRLTLTKKVGATPKTPGLVLGGLPAVRLLPSTYEDSVRLSRIRRKLVTGLVAVVIVALAGVGVATAWLAFANSELESEQARSGLLKIEQQKYSDVTTLESQLRGVAEAQPLAASGEVQWAPYLVLVGATLPPDTVITAINAKLSDAADPALQVVPLQAAHVAVVGLTVNSPQASVSDWLDSMRSLPGFVDATPGNVVLVPETGRYTVAVDLLINDVALAKRFEPKDTK